MEPAASRDATVSGRILIVDCHQTAASAQAARYAREAGIPTILDVEKVRPGIADLLQNIDAIIAAQEFPAALTGHEQLGRALDAIGREFGAAIVTVTLGAEGTLTWCLGREIRTLDEEAPTEGKRLQLTVDYDLQKALEYGFKAPEEDLEDVLTYANAVARSIAARSDRAAASPLRTRSSNSSCRACTCNFSVSARSNDCKDGCLRRS